MIVLKEDLEYVAELSKLSFTEDEKVNLLKDLEEILHYMDKLKELDIKNVDSVVNPYYMENKFREDKVEKSMKVEDVLKNSPNKFKEYFIVPKIIE